MSTLQYLHHSFLQILQLLTFVSYSYICIFSFSLSFFLSSYYVNPLQYLLLHLWFCSALIYSIMHQLFSSGLRSVLDPANSRLRHKYDKYLCVGNVSWFDRSTFERESYITDPHAWNTSVQKCWFWIIPFYLLLIILLSVTVSSQISSLHLKLSSFCFSVMNVQ